jgi:hypothetical protein
MAGVFLWFQSSELAFLLSPGFYRPDLQARSPPGFVRLFFGTAAVPTGLFSSVRVFRVMA